MNILFVSNITDNTAVKTSRLELAQSLRKRNHNVIMVKAHNINEKKSNNTTALYIPRPQYPFIAGLIFGIILFIYLPLIIRKKHIDVIIIDGAKVWLPFVFSLRLLRIPIILDFRTLPVDTHRSIMFDISVYLSKYFTDAITTITPELEYIIRTKYHVHDKKIGLWSSGVSIETFTPDIDIDPSLQKYQNSSSFVLLYHGGYAVTRGIEDLIRSIGELEDPIKQKVKLMIVGFSPYEESEYPDELKKLPKICKHYNIESQVDFISHVRQEKIPQYIAISDVGIIPLPPQNEWWKVSSPLKTLEYLAMGKPIIATNIPFHKKIFKKAKCGILLENNNPKEIAKAITYLYQNKDKLSEMGEIGKEIVKNNYTWDNKAKEVEDFIKTVLAGY